MLGIDPAVEVVGAVEDAAAEAEAAWAGAPVTPVPEGGHGVVAPTSARATWAAFSVGVTTISRRPCRCSRSRAAASVVVLPAPAAPSTTNQPPVARQ